MFRANRVIGADGTAERACYFWRLTLAVLGLLFGMYDMSTRLKLKSDPTSSSVSSVAVAVTPQLKRMIVDRLTMPAQPAVSSPGPSTLDPEPSNVSTPPAAEPAA